MVEQTEQTEQTQDTATKSSGKTHAPVSLKGEIDIFPNKRLDYLDKGVIKAYEAVTKGNERAFAMVCEKNIIPQTDLVTRYASMSSVYTPKLLGCGVVEWAPDLCEKYVFVYENNLGKPIWHNRNPNAMGLKPDLALATIFRNVLSVIQAMADKNISHGAIRVTNMFDGGKDTLENAMIGECLAAPAGYMQPALYEPIHRAYANPLGRGETRIADDMYALGVALTLMIRNHDSTEGMSDEDIIAQKVDVGTFNLLTSKDRFPGPVVELLRGLLHDDPVMRWDLDDMTVWFEGRRVSAKQGTLASLKASRPVDFIKKKFLRPAILGMNFHKDPANVVDFIEKGELFLWLNRSLQNKDTEQRYEQALEEAKKGDKAAFFADRVAACMAIALAPGFPITYRGLKLVPAGLGAMLVDGIQSKKDMGPYVDFIQSGLALFWSTHAGVLGSTSEDTITRIENCRMFLKQAAVGYGLERCVYYLSPTAPCLSDKLAPYFVRSAEDYLRALEKMSKSKMRPDSFFDRHIIAFLLVSDKNVIEPYLADLNASEPYRVKHGVLRMFTAIQRRDKMEALPGLTDWVSSQLGVVIERHHDRDQRKKIKDDLEKIRDKGNFEKISLLFDNFEKLQHDMRFFNAALKQFQMLRREFFTLEHELENNKEFGLGAGKQTAALVSGVIAAIVVLVYLVFNMAAG